uniref:Nematode cuticle collagen N-terminal domain-containing protein n=1 Tax=Meloidogyne enterolobii TaxID=390850 RepID=A0A6V7VEC6_MELEN|nr:unnamed protein product [Meloidogyne enterolobii]
MENILILLGCSSLENQEENIIDEDVKMKREIKNARQLAMFSICCCCCSIVLALVTLPALLSSVRTLHSDIQIESDFCRIRLRNFWTEMENEENNEEIQIRQKRAWLFGRWVPDSSVVHAAKTFTGSEQKVPPHLLLMVDTEHLHLFHSQMKLMTKNNLQNLILLLQLMEELKLWY